MKLKCEYPQGCDTPPNRIGLLQVANPSAEWPEGIQREVNVCDLHSVRWNDLWGTWPMPGTTTTPGYGPTSDDYLAEVASYRAINLPDSAKFVEFEVMIHEHSIAERLGVQVGDFATVEGRLVAKSYGQHGKLKWAKLQVSLFSAEEAGETYVPTFEMSQGNVVKIIDAPDSEARHKCVVRGCEWGAVYVGTDREKGSVTVCRKHARLERISDIHPVEVVTEDGPEPHGEDCEVCHLEAEFKAGRIPHGVLTWELACLADEVRQYATGPGVSLAKV